jgi:energy-coupling factor transport system substrate-specific component
VTIVSRNERCFSTSIELLFCVVIGIVFGVVNAKVGAMLMSVIAGLGPQYAFPLAIFQISQILVMYVVRKPGFAFLTMVINGIVQLLSGSPYGLMTVGFGICQGAITELVYALGRYRHFSWKWNILGAFAAPLGGRVLSISYEGIPFDSTTIFWGIFMNMVASGIESGILATLLGRGLYKTGLLKSFSITNTKDILGW